MLKTIYILSILILSYSFTYSEGWIAQESGTESPLRSVFFASPDSGWVVGASGTILFTSNGGENWNTQVCQVQTGLYKVFFTSRYKGWIVAFDGNILYTYDAGYNWNPQSSGTEKWLRGIHMINESKGFIVGYEGALLKTNNGGSNWEIIQSGTDENLFDVAFADNSNGVAIGNYLMLNTNNGGATWNVVSDSSFGKLKAICFADENNGWTVGQKDGYGIILKTTDAGANWEVQIHEGGPLVDVYFSDDQTGWASGLAGLIMRTTDGGGTWETQNTETDTDIRSVYFTDKDRGWAVGLDGVILHTDNGGVSSVFESNEETKSANYPNPFSEFSVISYQLSEPAQVKVDIFNSLGTKITTLIDEYQEAGEHQQVFDAGHLPAGMYYYTISIDEHIETGKMALVR